jgi:ADP-dependent NAD(P)H-hydrate dehydratase / NAD(P)H-hydrate epimerase
VPDRPLSAREVRVLEANAVALGVSLDDLMENAGRAVAEEAAKRLESPGAPVAIVASTGNNGGDGFAAAHFLGQWGYRPELWLVGSPAEIRGASARRCYDRAARHHPTREAIPAATDLERFPLVIDALLGTGQRGELRGGLRGAVEGMTASGRPVLSIDLPTGMGTELGVHPRWTVTFSGAKEGMEAQNSGEILVRDIGIPDAARRETGPGEFYLYPTPTGARSVRLLVLGGGPFAGAPALTALAALRAGAERATVVAPSAVAAQVQGFSPNLVVRAQGAEHFAPADLTPLLEAVRELHPAALAVGMGAGRHAETVELYRQLFDGLDPHLPLLVDADALDPFLASGRRPRSAPTVLSPNSGELHRLFPSVPEGEPERREFLASKAAELGVTLLAKGEPDLLLAPDGSRTNRHHHPAGSVSGVGDLLSGVVGFLLGAHCSGLEAARLASYWVGEAGIRAFGTQSYGLVATDVLEELPATLSAGRRTVAASP